MTGLVAKEILQQKGDIVLQCLCLDLIYIHLHLLNMFMELGALIPYLSQSIVLFNDTRAIQDNAIFLAIKTDKCDGHGFLIDAQFLE